MTNFVTLLNKKAAPEQAIGLGRLYGELREAFASKPAPAKLSMAVEGWSDADHNNFTSVGKQVEISMQKFQADTKVHLSPQQYEAAAAATALTMAVEQFAQGGELLPAAARPGETVVASNGVAARRLSIESFDESANRNVLANSVTWNAAASQQFEFGKYWFPTVVVDYNVAGVNIAARTIYAWDGLRRLANGNQADAGRRNVIRALQDHTILAGDYTDVVPAYRKAATANPETDTFTHFVVDTANGLNTTVQNVAGEDVETGWLAVGKKFNLLAVAQTNGMIKQGLTTQTESIDPAVRLDSVLLKLTRTVGQTTTVEYVEVPVRALPSSDYTAATQGNDRRAVLQFTTKDVPLDASTLTTAGTPSTILSGLTTNTARVSFDINASLLLNDGDFSSNASTVLVNAISDVQGSRISLTGGTGATLKALIEGSVTIVGLRNKARRANLDHASLGRQLDMQTHLYQYNVPVLSPFGFKRPTNAPERDAELVQELVNVTRIKNNNDATTAVLTHREYLRQYASQPDVVKQQPMLFGAASNLVLPYFNSVPLNVADTVNSPTHAERLANIRALVINTIRDQMSIAAERSGYYVAAQSYYGMSGVKPLVMIALSNRLYQWLMIDGENRLLGNQFNYVLVPMFDDRFEDGTILATFGNEAALTSNTTDLLHYGTQYWRPELVVSQQITRGNSTTQELRVAPSYLHQPNLPVMIEVKLSGLSEAVTGSVALFVKNKVLP